MSKINYLKNNPLFSMLEDSEIKNIADYSTIIKKDKSNTIFDDGQKANFIYILLEGKVKVYKETGNGKQMTLKVIHPHEVFGEIALTGIKKYPANAIVIKDCKLLKIKISKLKDVFNNNAFRDHFIEDLGYRLNYMLNKIYSLTVYEVDERFFRYLKESDGIKEEYNIKISKKEFSEQIGTIQETFSRMLKKLKKKGLISWERPDQLTVSSEVWKLYKDSL